MRKGPAGPEASDWLSVFIVGVSYSSVMTQMFVWIYGCMDLNGGGIIDHR